MFLFSLSTDMITLLDLIPSEALIVALKLHQLSLYENTSNEDGWELKHINALEDLVSYVIGKHGSGSSAGREAVKLLDLIKYEQRNCHAA